MSLASFPPTEVIYNVDKSCDPVKVSLTFRERSSKPSGEASPTDAAPPPPPSSKKPSARIPAKPNNSKQTDDDELQEAAERLKIKMENIRKRKDEFQEKGVRTALYGAVEQKVQSALLSTDYVLREKRSRLRELLLAEDVAYTTEYIAMCQQATAKKEEEMRARALHLKQKKEREREEFAELKRLEQRVQSCDAARPTLTHKQLQQLKQDQLWQIREKYALIEAQREEDRMYHDLMLKNIEAMKENEEEIARLAWKKQKEIQEAFVEQMKLKEQKEHQERQLKEFERQQLEEELRLLKAEGEKDKEQLKLKKEKLKAEARKLMEVAMEMKEKRKREEEEIDETFSALIRLEEEKEKRKESSDKGRIKREMETFLENCRELKRKKEEEERMIDKLIEDFTEQRRKEKDAERRKLKAAKEELFQNVLKGREEQIREKEERERREAENERREIELMELQIEQQKKIRDEYERKCAQKREEYKCQLLQQIADVEEKKKRFKEEEEEYLRKKKEEEEKEIEEVKRILKAMPIFPKDHPFKTFVQGNPPKYPCLHPYLKK